MPFFTVPPIRLTPTPSASNTVTATTNGSAQFNNLIDTATAQNLPGAVALYKDSQGQVSWLAYSIAQASILYGAALQHAVAGPLVAATGVGSTQVRSGYDTNCVSMGSLSQGGYPAVFAGIAAGSVVNTGAYFWRYISGFVPEALVGSAVPSGHLLTNFATAANWLGSLPLLNATNGSNGTMNMPVGWTVGIAPANGGLASVFLGGWYY